MERENIYSRYSTANTQVKQPDRDVYHIQQRDVG